MKLTDLTDKQRAMLSTSDRKSLGRAAMTADEAQERFAAGEEKKLQSLIDNYLVHVQPPVYVETDPFGKKVIGGPVGRADRRICYRGRWISIECKAGRNNQDPDQIKNEAEVTGAGGIYIVARSIADVQAVLRHIDTEFPK